MKIKHSILLFTLLSIGLGGCKNDKLNPIPPKRYLLIIANDLSLSTKTYPKPDSSYLRSALQPFTEFDATVVTYRIGAPNNRSGLRCTIRPNKPIDQTLVMSAQIKQKNEIKMIELENSIKINEFIKISQNQIFNDSIKESSTDILGFFDKINTLLSEPQYASHRKLVFIISDGIHTATPQKIESYKFQNMDFTFATCGWKAKLPDNLNVLKFESPQGFIDYLNKSFTK